MNPASILQQSTPTAEEARQRAQEILDASVYKQVVDETALHSAFTDSLGLWNKLQAWIANLAGESPALHFALLCGLMLLLALLIGHMVWSWLRFRRMRVDPFGQDRLPEGMNLELVLRSALKQAEEAGHWTDALGLRFRLVLWRLQIAQPGRVLPGWTNRELLARWPGDAASLNELRGVVQLLDRTWYAETECTESEYREAAHRLDEVNR